MVDNFSYLTYVNLMRSKMQEYALAESQPLKYGLPHLELKLTDIMQTMEYLMNNLSDQKFRMPTRLQHFVGLDLIIRMPLLKE